MKVGDLVRIKKEWCNTDTEHGIVYAIVEVNGARLYIQPTEWKVGLVPTELVTADMLERA